MSVFQAIARLFHGSCSVSGGTLERRPAGPWSALLAAQGLTLLAVASLVLVGASFLQAGDWWNVLATATALVPLGLLVLLWRRMSHQFRALSLAARRWAGGAWGYRVQLEGEDELSQLGRAFDRM